MTGDQLKRWRDNRGMTQDQLAAYLGGDWTRQKIANVESERTTMADDIEPALAVIDATLNPKAGEAAALPKKPRYDYSAHKCWDLMGNVLTMDMVRAKAPGFQFYRMDNSSHKDPVTGHPLANLWETTRQYPNGQCTYFQLDLMTWQVQLVAWKDNPRHITALPKLQSMMQGKRDALEHAKAMAAAEPHKYALDPTTLSKSIFDSPA